MLIGSLTMTRIHIVLFFLVQQFGLLTGAYSNDTDRLVQIIDYVDVDYADAVY